MRPNITPWLVAATLSLASAATVAQEVITLEGARIRGGQEAPLVLYLLPWQPPEARSLDQPDEQLMLAKPMEPLERAEFRRLIGYHQHFQAMNEAPENADSADRGAE